MKHILNFDKFICIKSILVLNTEISPIIKKQLNTIGLSLLKSKQTQQMHRGILSSIIFSINNSLQVQSHFMSHRNNQMNYIQLSILACIMKRCNSTLPFNQLNSLLFKFRCLNQIRIASQSIFLSTVINIL